jgi:hypothetical protein
VLASPEDVLTEDAAAGFAGAVLVICEADGVSLVLGSDAMVIISEPRDELGVSGVWSSGRFHLHGPFVDEVGVRLFGHRPGSPQWSWTRPRDPRPIHLLVRLPEGCLYLGRGKPVQGEYHNGHLLSAKLAIVPELSVDTLDRVRPPAEPAALPGLDWLADVTADPAAALERFVEDWVPATSEDLGELDAHRWNVPDPLAELYRLARNRPVLLGVQNRIRRPREWKEAEGGLVEFGDENQGGFVWLFEQSQADPAVWIDQDDYGLRREHEPMSGFLLQFALYETMMNAPYIALGTELAAWHVERLTGLMTPLPWEPWRWPNDSTRFFVAPGMIAEVTYNRHGKYSAWVGALQRGVLRPLNNLEIPWTSFDG